MITGSSNGRKADFDSVNLCSSPSPVAKTPENDIANFLINDFRPLLKSYGYNLTNSPVSPKALAGLFSMGLERKKIKETIDLMLHLTTKIKDA